MKTINKLLHKTHQYFQGWLLLKPLPKRPADHHQIQFTWKHLRSPHRNNEYKKNVFQFLQIHFFKVRRFVSTWEEIPSLLQWNNTYYLSSIHKKWYFVTKIVLTYFEKKLFWWSRKTFEIRISNIFEITRTIYSNSERSEQFLVKECFFYFFLEVSQI